jgi:hypothetical protein
MKTATDVLPFLFFFPTPLMFIVTSSLYYKSFTIIIYDRNDSTIEEPVLYNYDYDRNFRYKPLA